METLLTGKGETEDAGVLQHVNTLFHSQSTECNTSIWHAEVLHATQTEPVTSNFTKWINIA